MAATEPDTPRRRRGQRSPWIVVARLALAVAALAVFAVAATAAGDVADDVAALAVFALLGVSVRLIRAVRRGDAFAVVVVFVGAAVLVLAPTAALVVTLVVGAGALLTGAPLRAAVDQMLLLLLVGAAGAAARVWAAAAYPPSAGPIDVSPTTVVVVAAVIAVAAHGARWVFAWLDRRARLAAWRAGLASHRLADLSTAGSAAVLGLLWLLSPPLIVLVALPLLLLSRASGSGTLAGLGGATDELTGLGNAGMMRVALAEELARSELMNRTLAVLAVDIDRMSDINGTYGIEVGDEIVWAVGEQLRAIGREYDVVARIGGDSFAMLLPEIGPADAHRVAERVAARIGSDPVSSDAAARDIAVSVSVGVAVYPGDADSREELLTQAELASAYARVEGGGRVAEAARLPADFRRGVGATERVVRPRPEDLPDTDLLGVRGARLVPGDTERLVRVSPEPLAASRGSTDRILWLVVVGAVLAAAAAAAGLSGEASVGLAGWSAFVLVGVGAEWFAESVYGRSAVSWSAVPLIALAAVGAPGLELVGAAVLVASVGGGLRRVRGRQSVFNAAVLVLATVAAGAASQPVSVLDLGSDLLALVVVGLVAALVFFVVDVALIAVAVSAATGARALQVYRDDLAWLVPYQVTMGVLAGAMAYADVTLGVAGIALLAVPSLGLHFAQRQFLSRTRDHVVRLRTLNEDLQHANTRIVRVNERLTEALEQVNNGYLVTVESLAAAVDAKDQYTGSHIDRVEAYGRAMLDILDPDLAEDEALLWGFRLHDVGKIGVPDRVLLKDGPLDEDEWEVMKKHPEVGAHIISAAPFLRGAKDVVLHHHERWDGRGYPFGLQGNGIPFSARAFTVVDAFDAMTSTRPYRQAMPVEQAMAELVRNQGRQFDPAMVEAFQQIPADEFDRISSEVADARHHRLSRSGGLIIPLADGRPTAEGLGSGDDPPVAGRDDDTAAVGGTAG